MSQLSYSRGPELKLREETIFEALSQMAGRTGGMGGAPCPIEVMKRVVEDMHCPEMVVIYGQTESSPHYSRAGKPRSRPRRGGADPDSLERLVKPCHRITAWLLFLIWFYL